MDCWKRWKVELSYQGLQESKAYCIVLIMFVSLMYNTFTINLACKPEENMTSYTVVIYFSILERQRTIWHGLSISIVFRFNHFKKM